MKGLICGREMDQSLTSWERLVGFKTMSAVRSFPSTSCARIETQRKQGYSRVMRHMIVEFVPSNKIVRVKMYFLLFRKGFTEDASLT